MHGFEAGKLRREAGALVLAKVNTRAA